MSDRGDLLRGVVILLAIAIISSGSLAALASITQPIVDERHRREFQAALGDFFGTEDIIYISAGDREFEYLKITSGDAHLGYVANLSAKGYGSDRIKMVVGFDNSFKVIGIKISTHKETPGLGAKVLDSDEFFEYLEGRGAGLDIKQVKEDVKVTSGATITAKGVINSIRNAAEIIAAAEGGEI